MDIVNTDTITDIMWLIIINSKSPKYIDVSIFKADCSRT